MDFGLPLLVGLVVGHFYSILLSIVYLLRYLIGVRCYYIRRKDNVNQVVKTLAGKMLSGSYILDVGALRLGEGWHLHCSPYFLIHHYFDNYTQICCIYCMYFDWPAIHNIILSGSRIRKVVYMLTDRKSTTNIVTRANDFTPRPWQTSLLKQIEYRSGDPALLMLIAGAPGTGKSAVLDILAHKFAALAPYVIPAIDLSQPGMSMLNIMYDVPDGYLPIIEFCEFDVTVKCALEERHNQTNEAVSHADNKTQLVNILDTMASLDNVIVVATMNTPISDFLDKQHLPFIRQGRFRHLFQVTDNELVEVTIPNALCKASKLE